MALRETGGADFKYRKRDPGVIKKRATQSGGGFDSIIKSDFPRFTPKVGENKVRILPPTFDHKKLGVDDHWGLQITTHRNVGADNATYLCLNKMKGKPCPVCDRQTELKEAGEEEDADKLKRNDGVVVWIIDRNDTEAGPKVWQMSWSQDKDINAICKDDDSGEVYVPDNPDEGYDLTFQRTGEGLKTRYNGYKLSRKATPIFDNPKKQKEVLKFVTGNPLDTALNFFSDDYIEKVLAGKASSKKDDDDDADEKPKRRTSSKKADDEDDEPKKPSSDDIDEMDSDELAAVIKKHKLEVDPDDFPKLRALRTAVAEALEGGEDEEKEEEDDSEEAEVPSSDEVDEMDEDALEAITEKLGLDVDLSKLKRLREKREAVNEALEEHRGGGDEEKEEEGEEEESDDKPSQDDIDGMDEDELAAVVKKHKLEVDLDDHPKLRAKRDAVTEALGLNEDEGEEEKEEEEEKPAKKDTKSQAQATKDRLAGLKRRTASK